MVRDLVLLVVPVMTLALWLGIALRLSHVVVPQRLRVAVRLTWHRSAPDLRSA